MMESSIETKINSQDNAVDHVNRGPKGRRLDSKQVNQPIQAVKFVPSDFRPTSIIKSNGHEIDPFSYTTIADIPIYNTALDRFGKWLGPLNVVPFFNALRSIADLGARVRKIQSEYPGEPCIRCNLGQDCVLITGNAAVHWLLSQPLDNTDRNDDNISIGPFGASYRFIGRSIPCLFAAEKSCHSKLRKHAIAIMEKRFSQIDTIIEQTFTYRLHRMIDEFAKDGSVTNLKACPQTLAGYFITMWLLGSEPTSDQAINEFSTRFFSRTATDNWVGNFLGQRVADAWSYWDGFYKLQDQLLDMVRGSRYYKQYVNMAKELGVEMVDFDHHLLTLVCLTGAAGIGVPFAGFIAAMGENLGSLSELRQELGMDDLTIASVSDSSKYPLLDSVYWEVHRVFIRGMLVSRRAKKGLLMPGGNGKAYKIREHDLMMGFYPLALRDESVFENPYRFNPRRYLDDPRMKKHTFPFGIPSEFDPAHAEWGCPVYAKGFGEQLLKVFMGKWVQRVDWSTTKSPEFMDNAIGEFRPDHIPFATLKYRQAYLDSLVKLT